jgi:hypothetical protein
MKYVLRFSFSYYINRIRITKIKLNNLSNYINNYLNYFVLISIIITITNNV